MADKSHSNDVKPPDQDTGPAQPPIARTSTIAAPSGPRGADARDAMADMAERAQLIGQEAGMKITAAMRDVIGTAAGLTGFAIEGARDLVQYMVRRGQLAQDDADRLLRDAEETHTKRHSGERGRHGGTPATADRGPAKHAPARDGTRKDSGGREPTSPRAAAVAKPGKKPATKTTADKKPSVRKAASKKRR